MAGPSREGEIIDGKYRILRLLGEGGMGAVYAGEHVRLKKSVAIKVLHAGANSHAEIADRFEREAQPLDVGGRQRHGRRRLRGHDVEPLVHDPLERPRDGDHAVRRDLI